MLNIKAKFGTAAAKLHPLLLRVITDLNVINKNKKQLSQGLTKQMTKPFGL